MPKTRLKRPQGQKLKQKGFRVTETQDKELAEAAKFAGLDEADMIRTVLAKAGVMTLEDKASVMKAGAKIAEEI